MKLDKSERWIVVALIVMAVFAIFLLFVEPPPAGAEGSRVSVAPGYPNAAAVAARIEGRLVVGDDLAVQVFPGGVPVEAHIDTDLSTILVIGSDVFVYYASGWPDQVTADALLEKVSAVARDPVDRVIRLVDAIHQWQGAHPRPVPPVPPAPPFDWGPWLPLVWGVVGILAVWAALWCSIRVAASRRRRKLEVLRRFEEFDPANPYGQYKPVDLGE